MSKAIKYLRKHHSLPFYSRKAIKSLIFEQSGNRLERVDNPTDEIFQNVERHECLNDFSPFKDDDGAVINEDWDISSVSDINEDVQFILSDSDNENEALNETNLNYSSEDSFPGDTQMDYIHPNVPVTVSDSMYMIKALESRHGLTKSATADIFNLIKAHLPESSCFPASYSEADKRFGCENEFTRHYYCETCFVKISETEDCDVCNYSYTQAKKDGNFFITFNIADKLQTLLGQDSISRAISESIEKRKLPNTEFNVRSLYPSLKLDSYDITCTFNTDGVPVFASSNSSLWPVMISVNELPILLRKKNIIVAALWFGTKQPNMQLYLTPVVASMNELSQNGINWKYGNLQYSSRIYFTVCSVDAVARCKLQGVKQFNGLCGCNWCMHPGFSVAKGRGHCRVYPYTKFPGRSNCEFRLSIKNGEFRNGIVSSSPLLLLRKFDIVQGFSVDYMHCILLGCVKTFTNLWLNTKKQDYYIGDKVNIINERILNTKVSKEIVRATRGIQHYKHWKASEWRTWVLILPVILINILPEQYLQHFSILSNTTYILNKPQPTDEEINKCEKCIIKFVKGVEILYGQQYVSYNVHQLSHLCDSVRALGPLWETSAFSFESMNGQILKYIKSSNGVLLQIARKINQGFAIQNSKNKLNDVKQNFRKYLFNRNSSAAYLVLFPKLETNVPNYVLQGISHYTNVKLMYASNSAIINGRTFKVEDSKKRSNNTIVLRNDLFGEIKGFFNVVCNCNHVCSCYKNFVLVKLRRSVKVRKLSYIYSCNLDHSDIFEIYPIECVNAEKCVKFTESNIVNYIKLPNLVDAE